MDPESFVRGGPTLIKFFSSFSFEGREAPKTLKEGNYRPASEMPFKWRLAGGPFTGPH